MTLDGRSQSFALAATCSRGLEQVLHGELKALGHAEAECGRGVVTFRGGLDAIYAANLWLRTATRVLRMLAAGSVRGRETLYELARTVRWEEVLTTDQSFLVEVAGRGAGLANTAFGALIVKDAVVDHFREKKGRRPSVDRLDPDVRVHLHLQEAAATISVDSSGEPLSHRGYRPRGGPAPLSESLAAGILLIAGYDGSAALVDPMCGTGTIAIEAALIATRTPPGIARRFACERWWFHAGDTLARLRAEGLTGRKGGAGVVASDLDDRAVRATRKNAAAAGVSEQLTAVRRDLAELPRLTAGSLIVSNPPYGHRLGEVSDLKALYRRLGDVLKQQATECTAWLLVGDPDLVKAVGLHPTRRLRLFNGPLECRLLRFDLYAGSRRHITTFDTEVGS